MLFSLLVDARKLKKLLDSSKRVDKYKSRDEIFVTAFLCFGVETFFALKFSERSFSMHTGSTRLLTRPQIVIAVATFLFHMVFLVGLGRWLWSREHYQFFPLVLIASGA